jgi:hypothetical protein
MALKLFLFTEWLVYFIAQVFVASPFDIKSCNKTFFLYL